ncbi:MAG: heme biosynthesis HemY N-terminal domain-containing protein [Aestuariivirga sp.]
MTKLIWRFALLVLAGLLFAWLADRPGQIEIQWLGRVIHVSVLVGIVLLGLGLTIILFFWKLFHKIWHSPKTAREHWRFRKHRKAYESLSRGIVAAGAGDASSAARHAAIASETLKNEPLVNLLTAQAAQLRGDKAAVKLAFEAMAAGGDTELLGLRGLFSEARQHSDWTEARNIAEKAYAKNPRLAWASTAVLQSQVMAKDWFACARTLEQQQKSGLLSRAEAHKKRAVVLAADALALEDTDQAKALERAAESHAADAGLVPAALVGARLQIAAGHPKKGVKIIRTTWAANPHPELALMLARAFASDTPEEKFERIRDLAGKSPHNIEAAYALAQAAFEAKRLDVARGLLQPFTDSRPQQRICALMAQIEDATGDKGRSREWLARAIHGPRDPVWVADGVASPHWFPVSPITGDIVSCEWKPPFEQPDGSAITFRDDAETSGSELPRPDKPMTAEPLRLPDDPGID